MVNVEASVKTVDKASLSCSDVLSMMSNISKIAHEKPSSVIISELSSSILESNCNGAEKDALRKFTTARLVATNWAVTAANCIMDTGSTTKDKLSLVLGEFDLSSSSDSNDGKR